MKTLEDSWQDYYQFTEKAPPRETLLFALQRFEEEGRIGKAIDLGCGNGRDTLELLRRGWQVEAIDQEAEAGAMIAPLLPADWAICFQFTHAAFDQIKWSAADFINASYALPFCTKQHFTSVWSALSEALSTGGRFAGQLFGERDEWAGKRDVICHSRSTIEQLLLDFQIEYWEEEEVDEEGLGGQPKHWHIHHLVACKKY